MARTFLLTLALAACAPSPRPNTVATHPGADPPDAPVPTPTPPVAQRSANTICHASSECLLLSRESLGCCSRCPILVAMTHAERDATARLCGLHNGGERCPHVEEAERAACTPENADQWRAVCRAGSCERVAR